MTRIRRKIIACCTTGLLLFAQIAVAGYACLSSSHGHDVMQNVTPPAAAKPCHDSNPKNLNLCKQHCDQSAQSVDNRVQAKIDIPALPVVAVVFQPDINIPKMYAALRELPSSIVQSPLYIRNCSFLI